MHARPAPRLNNYHRPKSNVIGAKPRVAPAWKPANLPNGAAAGAGPGPSHLPGQDAGSRILVSNLPADVEENEIVDLMKKTVGPVKDSFMIYNSQGNPKGMAVIAFHRPDDAGKAREKYHGKVIDGRKAIKIELIVDRDAAKYTPPLPIKPKSLFDRIAPHPQPATSNSIAMQAPAPPARVAQKPILYNAQRVVTPQAPRPAPRRPSAPTPYSAAAPPAFANSQVSSGVRARMGRLRQKMGARRVQTRRAMTAADLDAEMDEYVMQRDDGAEN